MIGNFSVKIFKNMIFCVNGDFVDFIQWWKVVQKQMYMCSFVVFSFFSNDMVIVDFLCLVYVFENFVFSFVVEKFFIKVFVLLRLKLVDLFF